MGPGGPSLGTRHFLDRAVSSGDSGAAPGTDGPDGNLPASCGVLVGGGVRIASGDVTAPGGDMPNLLDLPRQALLDLRSRLRHQPLVSQLPPATWCPTASPSPARRPPTPSWRTPSAWRRGAARWSATCGPATWWWTWARAPATGPSSPRAASRASCTRWTPRATWTRPSGWPAATGWRTSSSSSASPPGTSSRRRRRTCCCTS